MKRQLIILLSTVFSIMRASAILLATHSVACDNDFLYPLCTDKSVKNCNYSSAQFEIPPDHMDTSQSLPTAKIGDRKFDRRAKVILKDETKPDPNHRFIGHQGNGATNVALFWSLESNATVVTNGTLDLNNTTELDRVKIMRTASYKLPASISFSNDILSKYGSAFLWFSYQSEPATVSLLANDGTTSSLGGPSPSRYFRHYVHPTAPGYAILASNNTDIHIKFPSQNEFTINKLGSLFDAFVIGDLDGDISSSTGLEFVAFKDGQPLTIIHENDLSHKHNDQLNNSLAAAMKSHISPIGNRKIEASCIADLNNDGFPELIIASNGNLYAFTYTKRTQLQSFAAFSPWTNLFIAQIGSSIKSITADDLNGDRMPDLIIETSTDLIFYRNISN
jgi:hypothetical protein